MALLDGENTPNWSFECDNINLKETMCGRLMQNSEENKSGNGDLMAMSLFSFTGKLRSVSAIKKQLSLLN